MEEKKMPLIGDPFPALKVQTTHGQMTLPDAFKGKWFILFSHPADFTPVCTTEFYAFQQRYAEFRELNTELIGLSVDQVFSHINWVEWIEENLDAKIEFPIIADTGAVADKLGLIHAGAGSSTVRAVFMVDPEGTIRAILYYPAELGRNFDEFLRMIRGFQVADEQDVAIPANWTNNELIGNRVIVPPAKDVETAKKRLEEFECYDWWLCHKPLEE
jgi:peroxiredoxin (alkyl hydroperoxide reductase subunit C)